LQHVSYIGSQRDDKVLCSTERHAGQPVARECVNLEELSGMHWPAITEWKDVAALAQALGIAAAAVYFGAKFVLGYLSINLTIKPIISRSTDPAQPDQDLLVVTLELVKGDRAALALEKLEIRLKSGFDAEQAVQLQTLVRNGTRALRLTPGESYTFAHVFSIPATQICRIEVFAKGASGLIGRPQAYWRCSAVSLPLLKPPLGPAGTIALGSG
jgi:hypothetical protein